MSARTWSGYLAWADTVLACGREFVAVARSFWLIPDLIPLPARDDVSFLYCVCRRLDDAIDETSGRSGSPTTRSSCATRTASAPRSA